MQKNIFEEYSNIIYKLKRLLQTFIENKISDKYPKFTDLDFIDKNIKDIYIYYTKLSKYISDVKFNNNYIQKIKDYKIKQIKQKDQIKNYIEQKHGPIYKGVFVNDINSNNNDICTAFKRLKAYTCLIGTILGKQNYHCITALGYINHNNFTFQSEYPYSFLKNNIDA